MGKQKKQELPDPEQQAIEEHVKQLMDPSVPDAPEPVVEELPTEIKLAGEPPAEAPVKGAKQKISVVHFDDEPQPAKEPSKPDPEAVTPEEPAPEAVPTAPVLVSKKARKIVPIIHEDEPAPEPEPEKTEEAVKETASEPEEPAEATPEVAEEEQPEQTPEEEEASVPDETPETVEEAEPPKPSRPKRFTPLTDIRPQPKDEPAVLTDPATAAAVDDIVAAESDQVIEAEDRERELIDAFKRPKPSFGKRLLRFFFGWWRNPVTRWLVLLAIFGGLAAAATVPVTRYFMLNTAGIRSSASLIVLDDSTQQPLKNVTVTIGEAKGITGADGRVTLSELKLGSSQVKLEKRAFALVMKTQVIGWGSNPLGDFKLTPTGNQYVFTVTDYLSDKPIEKVEASSGEASAVSNAEGEIRLTTDQKDIDALDITIKGAGYREEKLKVNLDDKQAITVKLVSDRKHAFVSKRSGKFDVFKIDIDGKNEERILAGTGTERDDMVVISHPSEEIAAVVSTRENKRNKDGFLLSTLTVTSLKSPATKAVITSERIQIVNWVSGRLVFVAIAEGESASSAKRHRLISYDPKTETTKEIAASNFFNDVMSVGGSVYYAPSSSLQKGGETGLIKVDAEGNSKEIIVNREVWNLFRTSYDHLAVATPQQWYDYRIGEKAPVKLEGAPANPASRIYIDSPDSKRSLWVDNRDGKGVLLFYDPISKLDSVIRTQSGLKGPVRWLSNNTLVFRINTDQESADFVLNLEGGEAKKIRDVTNTGGLDKWYYY